MQHVPIKQLPRPQHTSGCRLSKSEKATQKHPSKAQACIQTCIWKTKAGALTGLGARHRVGARGRAGQESRAPPSLEARTPPACTLLASKTEHGRVGCLCCSPRHSLHAEQSVSRAEQEKALKIQLCQAAGNREWSRSCLHSWVLHRKHSPTNAVWGCS